VYSINQKNIARGIAFLRSREKTGGKLEEEILKKK